jgi:two-component system LytT family sensor kinase
MRILERKMLQGFWVLNMIAWTSYGLISFVGVLPYVGLAPHLNSIRGVLVNRAAFSLMGLLNTGFLRLFYRQQRRRVVSLLEIAVRTFPLSCLAGLAATAVSNWAREFASGQPVGSWASIFGGTVSAFAVYLCWCACYFAFQTYRDMESEQTNALRAKATAQEAQLTALRGQLNPHFLFNSLTSIQALIAESPARAQESVVQLASVLRHCLTQIDASAVPLCQEIDVIRKYLAIEKLRFEENLTVHLEVEPETAQWSVPAFLLQPLVENAVRYGMETSPMPLLVSIRTSKIDGGVSLEVANSGQWLSGPREHPVTEGNGIGLRLVREHLEQRYRGRYRFTHGAENGWVVQRIEIMQSQE